VDMYCYILFIFNINILFKGEANVPTLVSDNLEYSSDENLVFMTLNSIFQPFRRLIIMRGLNPNTLKVFITSLEDS